MQQKSDELKLDTREDADDRSKVAAVAPPRPKKQSAGNDPYIRALFGIAALAVIGALLTVIFAVIFGVVSLDPGRAETIEEFAMKQAGAFVEINQSAENYGRLALTQIANSRYIEAQQTINMARAMNLPDEERNQALEFAYAYLALEQGDTEAAIERFENTMRQLREDFDRMYNSTASPNWARAAGMHPNYYTSAYMLALAYGDAGDLQRKLEMLDIAVEGNPHAADLLTDRGLTKLELGDTAGAIEDFNEALRFVPDDATALEGLERAGGN